MIPEVIFKKFGLIHTGKANRPLRVTKLKVKNRQAYFKPFIDDGENWVKVYRDGSNYEFWVPLEFLQDNSAEILKKVMLDTLR